MEILVALMISSIACFSNDEDSVVTLSGKIIESNVESVTAQNGAVFVQPLAYRKNIDSSKINPGGTFSLSLRKGHIYTLVFNVSKGEEYSKILFIKENSEVSVLLPSSTAKDLKIEFVDTHSYSARINKAGDDLLGQMALSKSRKNSLGSWRAYQHTYDSLKSINADSITIQQYLLSQIGNLWFTKGDSTRDSAIVLSLFDKVPPSTPLWSYVNCALFVILEHANSFEYVDNVINSQTDPWMKGWLMMYYLPIGTSKGDSVRVRRYAREVVEAFGGTEMAMMAKPFMKPDSGSQNIGLRMSRLAVGMKLPRYRFPLLGNTSKTVSNNAFLGKKYLLSFWATWCGQCVQQMRYLESAYKKFHPRGLELISITLDKDLSKVHSFRKNAFPMPWLNAFAPEGFDNSSIKALGIFGLPADFLIDENGIIHATTGDLLKSKLDRTLERSFKK